MPFRLSRSQRVRQKVVAALTTPAIGLTGSTVAPPAPTGINGAHPVTVVRDPASFERRCVGELEHGRITFPALAEGPPVASTENACLATRGTAPPPLTPLRAEWLGGLTGPGTANPLQPLGIRGTDLGISGIAEDGRVWFLLGDSNSPVLHDRDSAAFVTGHTESGIPKLAWQRDPSMSTFLPLGVKGDPVALGAMHVPVEAVEHEGQVYVFFTQGFDFATHQYSGSVLVKSEHDYDFSKLHLVHSVPTRKFVNVSVVKEGGYLYIFGSGSEYRQSPVHLARVKPEELGNRGAWEYFRGNENGVPAFVRGEENATPVVDHRCVGELSVRFNPTLGAYQMTYNCGIPRGIQFRHAPSPTGPWSEPITVFDPAKHGFGKFMHAPPEALGRDDGLADPGRMHDWSGEYGPYVYQPSFRDLGDGYVSFDMAMSTWNPYQIAFVRVLLGPNGAPDELPPEVAERYAALWKQGGED